MGEIADSRANPDTVASSISEEMKEFTQSLLKNGKPALAGLIFGALLALVVLPISIYLHESRNKTNKNIISNHEVEWERSANDIEMPKGHRIDFYILHDISESKKPGQMELRRDVKIATYAFFRPDTDRRSCSFFGSTVFPKLRPANIRQDLLDCPREPTPGQENTIELSSIKKHTNIAGAIDSLLNALQEEAKSPEKEEQPHTDLGFIITDGAHDTQNTNRTCPTDTKDVINDDLRDAVKKLSDGTSELLIDLRLIVLLAQQPGCPSEIQDEWDSNFKKYGVKVVTVASADRAYKHIQNFIKTSINGEFFHIEPDPTKPSLLKEQRTNLEKRRNFYADFVIRATPLPGAIGNRKITLKNAEITPRTKDSIAFKLSISDANNDPPGAPNPQSNLVFSTSSLQESPRNQPIAFKYSANTEKYINPEEDYDIRFTAVQNFPRFTQRSLAAIRSLTRVREEIWNRVNDIAQALAISIALLLLLTYLALRRQPSKIEETNSRSEEPEEPSNSMTRATINRSIAGHPVRVTPFNRPKKVDHLPQSSSKSTATTKTKAGWMRSFLTENGVGITAFFSCFFIATTVGQIWQIPSNSSPWIPLLAWFILLLIACTDRSSARNTLINLLTLLITIICATQANGATGP